MTPSPHRVDVEVDPRFVSRVDSDRLRGIAVRTLMLSGRAEAAELTIVITDDDHIQELNRQFRGLDEATDVLSFITAGGEGPFVTAPEAIVYLGDVVISYPRAALQAGEAGHSIHDELDLLVAHGVLHLLGWEDETEEGRTGMWSKQQDILSNRDRKVQ